jgi:hypothetical protein
LEGSAITGNQSRPPARLPFALSRGNFLRTDAGKAEIFLGAGVIARLGANTLLRMVETNSANPLAALEEGMALVEISGDAEAALRIRVGGAEIELFKQGLYALDAANGTLRVFAGEAAVTLGNATTRVKESQRLDLRQPGPLAHFDTKIRDALFKWSAERSFALVLTPAAFMTPWEAEAKRGWYKHKVFGERRDPRPGRPRFPPK